MQKVLFQQLPDADLSTAISLLSEKADYDADHQRPIAGAYTKDKPGGPYLRRLEDIDESWVRKYLEDALTGLKINKYGGIREYNSRNREASVFIGEDGEITEEGDLLLDTGEHSPVDVAEAKSKLPYLLKRLYDKSLLLRVSAMSLIIAYEKAKVIQKVPRPKDILASGVYRMGKNGNLEGIFPDSANSGKVFPPACDWIRGLARDPYFSDALELVRICGILGIDIKEEDPLDYQAADVAKLQVTYISKNRDYLSGAQQRNLSVLDTLSNIKVSDYSVQQQSAIPISVRAANTIQAVLDCEAPDIKSILSQGLDYPSLNSFFRTYAEVAPDFRISKQQHFEMLGGRRTSPCLDPEQPLVPVLDDFITRDGFLYSPNNPSIPQMFRVRRYVDEGVAAGVAIAHSSGYFFLVAEGNSIYYLDAVELKAYIQDYQRAVFSNKYAKNHKYGRWDMCYV